MGTKSAPRSCPFLVPDYGELQTLARLESRLPAGGIGPRFTTRMARRNRPYHTIEHLACRANGRD